MPKLRIDDMGDLQIDFDVLDKYRKKAKLKKGILIQRIGVHATTFQNWRRGATSPDLKYVSKIIDVLNHALLQSGCNERIDLLMILKRHE